MFVDDQCVFNLIRTWHNRTLWFLSSPNSMIAVFVGATWIPSHWHSNLEINLTFYVKKIHFDFNEKKNIFFYHYFYFDVKLFPAKWSSFEFCFYLFSSKTEKKVVIESRKSKKKSKIETKHRKNEILLRNCECVTMCITFTNILEIRRHS